jgi:hypothetical protein
MDYSSNTLFAINGDITFGVTVRQIAPANSTFANISTVADLMLGSPSICRPFDPLTCRDQPTGMALHPGGSLLYIAHPAAGRIFVVARPGRGGSSSGVLCPPGYACPCGTPLPCADAAAGYCTPGLAASVPVSTGYYAVTVPSALSLTVAGAGAGTPQDLLSAGQALPQGFTTQARCPRGSYCVGGVRLGCPRGRVGLYTQQSAPQGCPTCPVGTYAALMASESRDACLSCPPGAVAAGGTSVCAWCPAGTHAVNATACVACPRSNSSSSNPSNNVNADDTAYYALGGAADCATLPAGRGVQAWDAYAMLTTTSTSVAQAATGAASGGLGAAAGQRYTDLWQWAVPVPIAVVALGPLIWTALYSCNSRYRKVCRCCQCHRGTFAARVINAGLTYIDMYALSQAVADGTSPVKRRSVLGGAVTVATFGLFTAVCVSLLMQFWLNNVEQLQPIMAHVLDDYTLLPPMHIAQDELAQATSIRATGVVALESGLALTVQAIGPRCGNVTWTASQLLAGSFNYFVATNGATGYAIHTFTCTECAFSTLSTLDLTIDVSCQSLLVIASAVGSSGLLSIGSYIAFSDCAALSNLPTCTLLSTVAVAMVPTLETLVNDALNQQFRGYSVLPVALVPLPNPNPSSIWLRVGLPLASTYTIQQVSNRTSFSQLFSSLIGLMGVFSASAVLLSLWRQLLLKFLEYKWRRLRKSVLSHTNPAEITYVTSPLSLLQGATVGSTTSSRITLTDSETPSPLAELPGTSLPLSARTWK